MNNGYRSAMEKIKLSDESREQILSALDQPRRTAHRSQPLRVAAIAACVCLLLAGTALAAGGLTGLVDISFFTDRPSYSDDMGDSVNGYDVDYEETGRFPLASFSEEIRADAAATYTGVEDLPHGSAAIAFNTWEQAEEYVGFDLMENSVLDSALPHEFGLDSPDNMTHCAVTLSYYEGNLTSASVLAHFIPRWLPDGSPIYIIVRASAYTDKTSAEFAPGGWSISYPDDAEFTQEEYITESGIQAAIVKVVRDLPHKAYHAHFTLNGVQFSIRSDCVDEEEALAELKAVLEAFEF